jgi:hypothetical protein
MKSIRTFACLLPVALASSMYGACARHTTESARAASPVGTTQPSASVPREAQEQEEEQEGRVDRSAGDPTNGLLRATNHMPLTDTQKVTVRSLEEQLQTNLKDTGAAFQTFRTDLAAQVRSGAIDQTKVQIDECAASTALQAHVAKEADTLNELHAALDPSQRKAAVAGVRARQGETGEVPGAADAGMQTPEDLAKSRQARMTRDLGLDTAQQRQVASLLAERPAPSEDPMTEMMEDRRRRTDALLTAFESDAFDARATPPAPTASAARMVHEGTELEVAFLSRLLPILRPAQRDKLATNLEGRGDARER